MDRSHKLIKSNLAANDSFLIKLNATIRPPHDLVRSIYARESMVMTKIIYCQDHWALHVNQGGGCKLILPILFLEECKEDSSLADINLPVGVRG